MGRRQVEEKFFKVLMLFSLGVVLAGLASILITVFLKGFRALDLDMLTKTPKGGYYIGEEGGILNAILGSLALGVGATFLALIISLPLVFYLNVYLKKKSFAAFAARFTLDLLWGIPSIVYGAFGFTIMVFFGWRASLLAAMCTIALLIIPIMARSMDEILKMISVELKEASYALGSTSWETAVRVIIPQALPGIITAILISFGRGIGDAAAVLFTAGFSDNIPTSLFKPVATLPLAIFFQLGTPFPEVQARGYASALILSILVLALSILSRILSRKYTKHTIK